MSPRPRAPSRVVTVPNVVTLVRLLLVPVFLWLLLAEQERVAAALLLGFLGATDWVDGYLARRFDQESELGRIVDPIADRLLLVAAAVGLLVDGTAPRWVLLLVLVREVMVSSATLLLAVAGARRIDVVWSGKAGAFALMFALPLFLLATVGGTFGDLVRLAAWCCTAVGLPLSWYAAILYVPAARSALRDGRAARARIQSGT